MSLEQGAAAVAVAAIAMYAIFGGADFGGGIWTLFAWGGRKQEQRDALEHAIGPVWETNHVWLILLVVTLFVAFPTAYAAIFTALYIPLFIALLGVVARGAAFAFHHYGRRGSRFARTSRQLFSAASAVTPFTFGVIIGGVSGGHIQLEGSSVQSGAFAGWLRPFPLVCGVIGLLICAFLAAAYMMPRAGGALRLDFRRRALLSSLALGAATTAAIPIARMDAASFADRLSRGSVLTALAGTAVCGVVTLIVIARGPAKFAPPLAAATVVGVVVAWALAQNPMLVGPGLSLGQAAAPAATLRAFLSVLPIGAAILVPSLALLYGLFSRERLKTE